MAHENPGEAATTLALLIVEDDPQIVRAIVPAFVVNGYDVKVVANGSDAIDLLDSQNWDALIIDLGLPDMDGTTVIAHLRSLATTPIIAISARSSDGEVEAVRSAGADGFLHKPFRTPQLVDCVGGKISSPGSPFFAQV